MSPSKALMVLKLVTHFSTLYTPYVPKGNLVKPVCFRAVMQPFRDGRQSSIIAPQVRGQWATASITTVRKPVSSFNDFFVCCTLNGIWFPSGSLIRRETGFNPFFFLLCPFFGLVCKLNCPLVAVIETKWLSDCRKCNFGWNFWNQEIMNWYKMLWQH